MTAEREYSRNEWPLSFLFKDDLHDDDNDDDKKKVFKICDFVPNSI